jgi:TonB-dependent SusC/RagA subfamily outer membrane receptor
LSLFGVLSLVISGFAGTGAVAQQTGTVAGTVREQASGSPVVGAYVSIEGSSIGAYTDVAGRYQLRNVPEGDVDLRVRGRGFATMVERVLVRGRQTVKFDVQVPELVAVLDAILVRGLASPDDSVQRREATSEVAPTVGDMLDRGVPGLNATRGSGQVGSGIRFRARGIKSITLPGAPLVYVDGVRVEYATGSLVTGVAGASVLDMIDPSSIERIEFLRGAEATAYGLGSLNGVILITTKRGGPLK